MRDIKLFLLLLASLPVLVLFAFIVYYLIPFIPLVAQVICLLLLVFICGYAYHWWEDKRLDREHKKLALQLERRQVKRYQQEDSLVQVKIEMAAVTVQLGGSVELLADGGMKVTGPHLRALPAPSRTIDADEPQETPIQPVLPGPCDFADILEIWRPSPQEIFLALAPGGQRVTVPIKALCHVALAGATGLGKSSLMRLLLPQLLYVGARVALADPHFTLFDAESDEDWRPIASRLAIEPAVSYTAIKDVLAWMAKSELPTRLEKRRQGQSFGEPFFLALDELPAIVANVPEAPSMMATLLREGRKVGLLLVSAAQDWLVKTVGGTGGVRDCFRTAFYVGGDAHTARVLLDVQGKVDDGGLGKGIVMLRSMATPKASLTRIPYASNEAIESLLLPPSSATSIPLRDVSTEAPSSESLRVLDARTVRIREMVKAQVPTSKIIEELWGVTGGTSYQKAARELSEIISSLV